MNTSELLSTIANNTPLIYEKGKVEGIEEGHTSGLEEGYNNGLDTAIDMHEEFLADKPQTYYDILWDTIQKEGVPTNYQYAFAYNRFFNGEVDAYNPKYDIKVYDNVTSAGANMFAQSTRLTDTKVAIYANKYSIVTMFSGCTRLKNIRKLVLQETTALTSAFTNCTALEELNIEGVIGQSGFDVHWSTLLNKTSIESIINALSSTTNDLTVTLSQTAVNNAFTSEEWEALEATKPNWTISLV